MSGLCSHKEHTYCTYFHSQSFTCAERESVGTFGKPNWFGNVKSEHAAACNSVALFDLSSFAKFEVEVGVQC